MTLTQFKTKVQMPYLIGQNRYPICDILVPEVFLDFSLHERAAREPQSGENTSREKKNQVKPLGPG